MKRAFLSSLLLVSAVASPGNWLQRRGKCSPPTVEDTIMYNPVQEGTSSTFFFYKKGDAAQASVTTIEPGNYVLEALMPSHSLVFFEGPTGIKVANPKDASCPNADWTTSPSSLKYEVIVDKADKDLTISIAYASFDMKVQVATIMVASAETDVVAPTTEAPVPVPAPVEEAPPTSDDTSEQLPAPPAEAEAAPAPALSPVEQALPTSDDAPKDLPAPPAQAEAAACKPDMYKVVSAKFVAKCADAKAKVRFVKCNKQDSQQFHMIAHSESWLLGSQGKCVTTAGWKTGECNEKTALFATATNGPEYMFKNKGGKCAQTQKNGALVLRKCNQKRKDQKFFLVPMV